MDRDETSFSPVSVQITVSPVSYAVALRPEDSGQLQAAANLACRWWGGIRFPWLGVAEDGSISEDAQEICRVLDVAGIIDLTRPDDTGAAPEGLCSLGLPIRVGDGRPPWAVPVRGVVPPDHEIPLITAGQTGLATIDPVVLVGLGDLDLP